MEQLKQRIRTQGRILPNSVLKVDSFLNHQLDPGLLEAIGNAFASRFAKDRIDKVLTVEASGIPIALFTAKALGVNALFAKKFPSNKQFEHGYSALVTSYTKGTSHQIHVDSPFLLPGERILIVDDFLANGEAATGLIRLVQQAQAEVVGLGIVIEKGFQPGGQRLRQAGIRVESLAIIEAMDDQGITFAP